MVYTAALSLDSRLGTSICLDHEYTSTAFCSIRKMPVLRKDHLAVKLRQNWLRKNPCDLNKAAGALNLDDSLTSLGWLHNMNIMKSITSPTPPPSPQPDVDEVNPSAILTVINNVHPNRPEVRYSVGEVVAPSTTSMLDSIDYRSNPYVKPPYSYATLICMAMKETGMSKITLASIYSWITDNFMYYRMADPSWQNSIRHNLSLNKCFQKVPRRKDEPGKGGFWRINPDYSDLLVDGVLKKRRTCPREAFLPLKRIKREPDEDGSQPCMERQQSNEEKVNEQRHLVDEQGVSTSDIMNGNYSWNQLLNQDIMVGGVTVKTEDIIDDRVLCLEEEQQQTEQAFVSSASPPSSADNSDSSLDDFWNMDFSADKQESPLDLSTSGFPLDLTIQGVGVKVPGWWDGAAQDGDRDEPGMHTPVHESESLSHPWSESRLSVEDAIAAFDIDNLFDADVPSPSL